MQLRDTLRHYVLVILRRFWFIGLGVLICTSTALAVTLYLPPVYQASALITVDAATITGTDDIYSNQALAFSYAVLVTKDDVLQAAVQQLPGLSVSQLKQLVSDSPIMNTPMIEVRALSATPQKAALIANSIAQSFIRIQIGKVSEALHNQDRQISQHLTSASAAADTAQTQLMTLQTQHAAVTAIMHQHNLLNTAQANYTALLESYHHVQLLELQTLTLLTISQAAFPPEQPIGPDLWLNVTVAAALSFLLMVSIVLLLDWMDETIKTEEDVTHMTTLRPLGTIPSCISKGPPGPVKFVASQGDLEEAFVGLGSSLLAQCDGKRSLLVTGIRPRCGSSTVATHLAIALARSGVRVLLIDANLRRPILHTFFQYYHIYNLVHCLTDMQAFQDTYQHITTRLNQWRTRTPYLWLLPAGPISLRPAALLSSPALRVLVQALLASQVIDMLIFDSAGLHEGVETLALASVTDATLLVIEAGKEKKEALEKAKTALERFNTPILGVVVNRWHKRLHSYFYTEHSQSVCAQPVSLNQGSQPGAQVSLPTTPRPHLLAQELTAADLLAQVSSSQQPLPPAQDHQSAPKVPVKQSLKKAVHYAAIPTRPLHILLPKRKGFILPAKPRDVALSTKRTNLRQFMNTDRRVQ